MKSCSAMSGCCEAEESIQRQEIVVTVVIEFGMRRERKRFCRQDRSCLVGFQAMAYEQSHEVTVSQTILEMVRRVQPLPKTGGIAVEIKPCNRRVSRGVMIVVVDNVTPHGVGCRDASAFGENALDVGNSDVL